MILKGAKVNYIGKSKFGGMSLAIKHDQHDGFVQVKDAAIDLNGVEKGSLIDVEIEKIKRDFVVSRLRLNAANSGSNTGTTVAGSGNADSRQSSIVMQTAYKVAGHVLSTAVAAGALGKKESASQEVLLSTLYSIALHVYSRCLGDGLQAALGELQENAEVQEAAADTATASESAKDDFEDGWGE